MSWYTVAVKNFSPEFIQWVVQQYKAGKSIWQIAQQALVARPTIKAILQREKIRIRNIQQVNKKLRWEPRKPGGQPKKPAPRALQRPVGKLTDIAKKFIIEQGTTRCPMWVAEKFQAPVKLVVMYYLEHGIPMEDYYLRYVPIFYWPADKKPKDWVMPTMYKNRGMVPPVYPNQQAQEPNLETSIV